MALTLFFCARIPDSGFTLALLFLALFYLLWPAFCTLVFRFGIPKGRILLWASSCITLFTCLNVALTNSLSESKCSEFTTVLRSVEEPKTSSFYSSRIVGRLVAFSLVELLKSRISSATNPLDLSQKFPFPLLSSFLHRLLNSLNKSSKRSLLCLAEFQVFWHFTYAIVRSWVLTKIDLCKK